MTVVTATIPMSTNALIIIFVAAIAYVTVSVVAQRKLAKPLRQQEIQAHLKNISKELNQMVKNNETKEKLAEKQKEILPHMRESMNLSIRPMLVILPLFLLTIYVILPAVMSSYAAETVNFIWLLHYKGLFLVIVIILGLVTTGFFLILDKRTAKKRGIGISPNNDDILNKGVIKT